MSGACRIVALLLGLVVTVSPAYAELEKTLVKSEVLNKAPLGIACSFSSKGARS
jgi:hypothetical protein